MLRFDIIYFKIKVNMKKFIKECLLPPYIFKFLVQSYSVCGEILKNRRMIVKDNSKFKDVNNGKRCFILGNGPSVNTIDLEILKNEDVIVMSNFYLHKDYNKINPKYHVIVKVYDNLIPLEDQIKWYKDMEVNVKCEAIFFNTDQYDILKKKNLFNKFNLNFISTANRINRKFDISKITKHHRTGPLSCLEIAIYMGYTEIYLLGIELDTFCSKEYKYFFNRDLMKTKDENIKDNDNVKSSMTELLYNNWLTYKDFSEVAEYAEHNSIKIFNLSEISKLDMFEKKRIESII